MPQKGINQTKTQESNRALLLRLLKHLGVTSRVELASLSGLQQATITYIINDFIKWGLVRETGIMSGEKGRRTIGIALNDKAFYVIGVRMTRQFFYIGLFNVMGKIVKSKKIPIGKEQTPQDIVNSMLDEIHLLRGEHRKKKILAAGLSLPGPYYPELGKIMAITGFEGWNAIDIKQEFENALDIPVLIEHDANAGALAEWWRMPLERSKEVLIYVAAGQGIGAGILSDGQLFKGAFGTAGEIGHISMDAFGEKCACNNRGCLTEFVSTVRLMKQIEKALAAGEKSCLKPGFTYEEAVKAIKGKDEAAYKVFHEEIVRYVGTSMVNLIWCYSPNVIIIGDELSEIGDLLIEELKQFVKDHTLPYLSEWTRIERTGMDLDPAFYGSGEVAIDAMLGQPAQLEGLI